MFGMHFYPIIRALFYSLNYWTGNPTISPKFVGLKNYLLILSDKVFWNAMSNTFLYVFFTVPLTTLLSMAIALLLADVKKYRGLYRAIYFFPSIIGLAVASIIWRWCYEPLFGVYNFLLEIIGIPGPSWLKDPKTALWSIGIMTIWSNLGYFVVIYLAGLTTIPETLYEAARIDGASRFKQVMKITVPLLLPTTFFVVMYNTIRNIKVFAEVFVMTGGGPGHSTETIGFRIYTEAFIFNDFGRAMAMSVVMFLAILAISIFQSRLMERQTFAY